MLQTVYQPNTHDGWMPGCFLVANIIDPNENLNALIVKQVFCIARIPKKRVAKTKYKD